MRWLHLTLLTSSVASANATTFDSNRQVLGNGGDINSTFNKSKQNIVSVLTDDQDVHLSSLDYMPFVKKHFLDQGTYFNKHYCTTATSIHPMHVLIQGTGGYPKFVTQGFNEAYLPVWLQQAGYNTYYTGKLFNVHTVDNYEKPYAARFTASDFLLDPYTYNYMNSTRDPEKLYEGEYSTDVLAQKAFKLLSDAVIAENPFFFTIAPIAPHANIEMNGSILDEGHTFEFGSPVPAKRHQHLFKGEKVPRSASFNPDEPSAANWILDLEQQNQTVVEYNDHFYRQRLRALQAVDEMVNGLFESLETHGILENTYIIYSSDNGFHIGQHRLQPGKSCGYEEDINIPLIIRGPDLAPTFFDLLGIPQRDDFDGSSIPITKARIEIAQERRRSTSMLSTGALLVGKANMTNNTYKAIRILVPEYNLFYSIWCNNEHELYDLDADPSQMHNLLSISHSTEHKIAGLPITKVIARLDSLLFVLKSCKGITCQQPWNQLHPKGDVSNLEDALSERFDHFYEVEQQRIKYSFCSNEYLIDAEGPMFENQGSVFRDGLTWYEWLFASDIITRAAWAQDPNYQVILTPKLSKSRILVAKSTPFRHFKTMEDLFRSDRLVYRAIEDTLEDEEFMHLIQSDPVAFSNSDNAILAPMSKKESGEWKKSV
ncbi:related to arylsulfatase [Rhynchosporium secalis]|uniref:Related to arylsulfatase n=1 Tax=Rhynchosporium secalis TaxID=38038 RepID=A0A1E1MCQ1_RHYSE|nr:related to arylsulfatase [Rhynchosporium secalis]